MNLPEDIILTEIPPKLPVKSLLRFSCVCRTWCAWIRDPHFGEMHLNQYGCNRRNDTAVFLRGLRSGTYGEKYLFLPHSKSSLRVLDLPCEEGLHLYGSCNGILCLSALCFGLFCLCNPITQECLELPCLGLPTSLSPDDYFIQALGFGFDPSTKDYKVIRAIQTIFNHDEPVIKYADIYKLSTDCWSELKVDLRFDSWIRDSGVFTNGCFHWCFRDLILTFDFRTEVFGKLQLPPAEELIPLSSYDSVLTGLDDSLAFIASNSGGIFDVWLMVEYGKKESWTKRYSAGPFLSFRTALTCWNDDKLVMECNSERQLISYFLNNGSADFLDICCYYLEAVIFQQTLVSLRSRRRYKF